METYLLIFIACICYLGFGFKTLLYVMSKSIASKFFISRIIVFLFWFIIPIGIIFDGEKAWEDD